MSSDSASKGVSENVGVLELDPDNPGVSVPTVPEKDSDENRTRTIPVVLDGKFFKIVKLENENVQATCTQCNRTIKGRIGATTNFLNHLKIKGHSVEEYLKYKNAQPKKSLKRTQDNIDNNEIEEQPSSSKKTKQVLLSTAFSPSSQQTADSLITSFVVQTMSPMCIVEHEAFKKLITGINNLHSPISVMTRKTLRTKIDCMYTEMLQTLLSTLQSITHVCTTADIWSSSKRSFLGVTAHWINESFERKSAALACRRFKGTHSHDRIAELLHDIHAELKVDSKKIVKTTTDNASNMIKAFTVYSQPEMSSNTDEDNDDEEEFVITGISVGDSGANVVLPEHQRCASHTLNLIAAVDIKAALKPSSVSGNSGYNRIYHSAFGKCSALWNLTSKSPKAAETYKDITKKSSSFPCPTRWNSLYDCLHDLMKVKDFLGKVCDTLELPKFKDTDFEFLTEYIECVQPIAEALDRLQGEKSCFYGELFSILLQMQKALLKLQLRHLKYCSRLVEVLLESLRKRFNDYYSFSSRINDAILASVSHPFFKLRWVPKARRNDIKELVFNEAESLCCRNSTKPNDTNRYNESSQSFFSFEEGTSSDASDLNLSTKNSVQLQCLQYLQNDDTSLDSLRQFPAMKVLFLKYNTPLPSSAPVERLFSYGGMVMRPNRRSMDDTTFETQLLLKANASLKP